MQVHWPLGHLQPPAQLAPAVLARVDETGAVVVAPAEGAVGTEPAPAPETAPVPAPDTAPAPLEAVGAALVGAVDELLLLPNKPFSFEPRPLCKVSIHRGFSCKGRKWGVDEGESPTRHRIVPECRRCSRALDTHSDDELVPPTT